MAVLHGIPNFCIRRSLDRLAIRGLPNGSAVFQRISQWLHAVG
jgi:hypothetical protein